MHRDSQNDNRPNAASFTYRVRIIKDAVWSDIQVCLKAFTSLYSIAEDKVRYMRNAALTTGKSPTDGREKYSSRPQKLSDES